MCGICGLVGAEVSRAPADSREVVTSSCEALAHRGPDGVGTWAAASHPVVLGHRRLAVIDLSDEAAQPMLLPGASERAITFNGEIYNYRDLRSRLEAAGATFLTESDTEVLLTACRELGPVGALEAARGMFAFAYYDEADASLWLARDRFGEKPLYYAIWDGTLAFASELKALRAIPTFPTELDRTAIDLLLRHSCIGGEHTIYRAARKVLPGEVVRVDLRSPITWGSLASTTYWDPAAEAAAAHASPFTGDLEEAAEELDRLLGESAMAATVSDVPVGALLSGGIDSTSVVSQLAKRSAGTTRTFTIGFGADHHSEAEAAGRIARHLGTHHTELILTAGDALDTIPRLPSMFDEPFADSSQIPTFLVAQLARRDVTVALTGDGGDELFAGYPRFRLAASTWNRIERVPRAARARGAGLLERRGADGWARTGDLLARTPLRTRSGGLAQRAAKAASLLRAEEATDVYRLLVTNFWEGSPLRDAPDRSRRPIPTEGSALDRMLLHEVLTYLPDDILAKVDRAAMAVSLETRVPFLTPELFAFAQSLPASFKIHGHEQKRVVRHLLRRDVPADLWDHPKRGFSIPIATWLRGPLRPWAEDLLAPEALARHDLFDPAAVAVLWQEHLDGRRDWASRLWNVLMFQAWYDAQA